ncbi:MAG: hypothetical protein H7252_05305 [Cytophaga sp.]|nr:hypothetical protein [Undibacterium sp.]
MLQPLQITERFNVRLAAEISSIQSFTRFSRSALPVTDTELKLIAAAAIIGESSNPKNGYSRPVATGTPSAL